MADRPRRGLAGFFISTYLLAAILATVFSVIDGLTRGIINPLLGGYTGTRAVALLIQYAVATQTAALLVWGSLFVGARGRSSTRTLLLYTVISAAVYGLLVATVQPAALGRLEMTRTRSSLALEHLDLAGAAVERGDLEGAREYLTEYLSVSPADEEAMRELDRVKAALAAARTDPAAPAADTTSPLNLNIAQLRERARRYLDQDDPFTAHYFAERAAAQERRPIPGTSRMSPPSPETAKVMADAERRMRELAPGPAELEATRLFQTKLAGRKALAEGDSIDAYYVFATLADAFPRDRELSDFLAQAEGDVARIAFFADEVPPRGLGAREARSVAFVNRRERRFRELNYCDRVVAVRDGPAAEAASWHWYFTGIEVIGFSSGVRHHLKAPLGKLIDGRLNVRALDRKYPALAQGPGFAEGTASMLQEGGIPLTVPAALLPLLTLESRDLRSLSLPDLWHLRTVVPESLRVDVDVELLLRALSPFLLLAFSLLAVTTGSRNAPRDRLRPLAFLLIPSLLVAAHAAVVLVTLVFRIGLAYLVVTTDTTVAAIVLGVSVLALAVPAVGRLQGTRRTRQTTNGQ